MFYFELVDFYSKEQFYSLHQTEENYFVCVFLYTHSGPRQFCLFNHCVAGNKMVIEANKVMR